MMINNWILAEKSRKPKKSITCFFHWDWKVSPSPSISRCEPTVIYIYIVRLSFIRGYDTIQHRGILISRHGGLAAKVYRKGVWPAIFTYIYHLVILVWWMNLTPKVSGDKSFVPKKSSLLHSFPPAMPLWQRLRLENISSFTQTLDDMSVCQPKLFTPNTLTLPDTL